MRSLCGPAALFVIACATPAHAASKVIQAPSVEEITVTGERSPVQALIDRKVYSVAADIQSSSGVAADVLNKIPSVNVDPDGAITLRGDSSVTILVDGKPSAQFNGPAQGMSLLQFPASDIARIEVLTNPPAQYKAEGSGGVINIVTKKTPRAGASDVVRASLGDKRRYVVSLDGAYNLGGWRLSGGLGLRQEAKERQIRSDHVTTGVTQTSVRSLQTSDERFRRLIPTAKFNLGYDIAPDQTLGLSLSHRELSGNRYFDQHDEKSPIGGAVSGISDRHSDGHEWALDDSKSITFEQKFGRPHETLTVTLQRSATRERERYAYRNAFALPAADPSFDHLHLSLDLIKTEFSADYDLPMSQDRELRLGLGVEADQNAFDHVGDTVAPGTGQLIPDLAITNHFRFRQSVSAAYVDYQAPLGAYRLDAGLRLEATHVSTLQITGDVSGGYNDIAAYPSLHWERSLGDDDRLTAALTRRVTRPDPESLNPFSDYQDTHNLRAGNPNLRAQDTWSIEAGYAHEGPVNYGATAYFRRDRNGFAEVVQPISDDVVLTTKANLPSRQSGGLEFNVRGKLSQKLSYSVGGDAFHMQINPGSLGSGAAKSTNGLNLKLSLDYRPTSVDSAQISFSRTAQRLTPQGEVGAVNLVNLGYKHDFKPDLALVVTISDLFDGQRTTRRNSTPTLVEVYERHQFGRVAYVGIVYSLGGPKKGRPGFEYEQ